MKIAFRVRQRVVLSTDFLLLVESEEEAIAMAESIVEEFNVPDEHSKVTVTEIGGAARRWKSRCLAMLPRTLWLHHC